MQLSIHIIDCEDSFLTRVMGINNFVEYYHTSLILLPIDYEDLFYTYVMGINNLLLKITNCHWKLTQYHHLNFKSMLTYTVVYLQ